MDKIEKIDKSLEEAARLYADNQIPTDYPDFYCRQDIKDAFIDGAEWQASQMPVPEDTVLFNKGVAEGRRLEREDMIEDIKLTYGKVSMDHFDCSEAFENLINKYEPNED